jgi:hypothetical protein
MEMDNLKSAWHEISPPQKGKEELHLLLKKNSYPVLASIKKQLIIELFGFTAFLFCYYSIFDGETKPLVINLTIIVAILLQLFHSYKGMIMQSSFKSGNNLTDDLENFIAQLKSYRLRVVLSRIVFTIGFITFFTYNFSFSERKWWILAFIAITFSIQLGLLYRLWSKRINKLVSTLEEFKTATIEKL